MNKADCLLWLLAHLIAMVIGFEIACAVGRWLDRRADRRIDAWMRGEESDEGVDS